MSEHPPKRGDEDHAEEARRDNDAASSRTWRVVNESVRNAMGQPVGYKLVPTMSSPTMLAHPDSSVGQRAGFV